MMDVIVEERDENESGIDSKLTITILPIMRKGTIFTFYMGIIMERERCMEINATHAHPYSNFLEIRPSKFATFSFTFPCHSLSYQTRLTPTPIITYDSCIG